MPSSDILGVPERGKGGREREEGRGRGEGRGRKKGGERKGRMTKRRGKEARK